MGGGPLRPARGRFSPGHDPHPARRREQPEAGQQQRVVVAWALFNQPEIPLADEPTSDVDGATEREIMDPFQAIHADTGVTILLVTHTSELVRYGTRHVRVAEGQIVVEED